MKLYFLQRTELADRVVCAFRVAEVEETEAAELIESETAIPFGNKRPMPRPKLIVDKDHPRREKEINSIRRKACREMIKNELNQIVYDRFQEYYGRTNSGLSRAARVATAVELMRIEAYPYRRSEDVIRNDKQWNAALLHVPPRTFPDYIPCEAIYAEDKKNPKKRKKIGERYLR